ncbi:MAG: heavy-metal-associated domain-containing protein [Betaproteobacteria bacterium]|nr:heavy-metal-associated domain-containing protein [Betaproteobacteria bacterium]MDE2310408.1 heavy-metal-associated domain-containing protein [Betaproteobacteria bacterium]
METIQLNIRGMTCNGCVNNVKNVLQKTPGVAGVEVSLEQNRATVTYDPVKASPAQFKAAVEDAGFDVV